MKVKTTFSIFLLLLSIKVKAQINYNIDFNSDKLSINQESTENNGIYNKINYENNN